VGVTKPLSPKGGDKKQNVPGRIFVSLVKKGRSVSRLTEGSDWARGEEILMRDAILQSAKLQGAHRDAQLSGQDARTNKKKKTIEYYMLLEGGGT